jgi:hypothetical protein
MIMNKGRGIITVPSPPNSGFQFQNDDIIIQGFESNF